MTDSMRAKGSDQEVAERLQEFVYGTITAMVALGALDAKNLGSARAATAVVIGTAIATWLAHAFAALVGVNVREHRAADRNEIVATFRQTWRIVTAAMPATAMLLIADLEWISLRTALTASTVIGILQLVAVALIAARRSRFTIVGGIAYVITATAIGLVIVVIELTVVHH
jgi:hypothetical protein